MMIFLLLLPFCQAFVSNFPEISNTFGVAKSAADLQFTGDYVCDKYASVIQSNNNTVDFPVDFNLYVSNTAEAPNDNYTVDLYFRNEYHYSYNQFSLFNVSESSSILSYYNAILISKQPQFGVEFKFNFEKGKLCQFLYQFTVAYQLEHVNNTQVKSDKIFVVGSCQENQRYHPDSYNFYIDQGFRCLEYNSGFKYDGGKDWCSKFYPQDQCCKSYVHDELTARDNCSAPTFNFKNGEANSSTNSTTSSSKSGGQIVAIDKLFTLFMFLIFLF